MTTTTMQPQRLLATACAYGLVTASAGFGAVYAYNVGLEHSTLLAILSVLMALGLEGCKPLAVSQAIRCKSARVAIPMACLGVVAIAYSLTAELSLMAANRGDLTAERTARAERAKEQDRRRVRAQDELSALGLQRPSAAIQAELNAVLVDRRLQNCQGWLANYKLRQTCIEKAAPLQTDLAKAERREKLEAELSGTTNDDDTPVVGSTDPGGAALATYLGALGLVARVEVVAQWLVLVPVLALELGSAMAVVLVHAVGPMQGNDLRRQPVELPAREPGMVPRKRASTEMDRAAQDILTLLRTRGGSMVQTERGLALVLGTSKPTARRALQSLRSSGALELTSTKHGTKMRLNS